MKIAVVVPGGVDPSGTERVIPCLLWLIERLVRAGDEVHVFALHQQPEPGRWPLLGAEVHNAGRRPRRLRTFAALAAEHRRGRFDLVHAFWAAGPGSVAGLFGRAVSRPVVLTLPGGDLSALPDISYGARLTRRGQALVRLAVAAADRVIVPSEWMAGEARALGIAATVLPFGVALDRWPPLPPRPRNGGPLRLIQVASLNRVKDQEMLIAAAGLLRDRGIAFRLDIIGEDTLSGEIQRQSASLGLDEQIRFHGFVPNQAVRDHLSRADLMLLGSRHDAGPVAVLEAAVAGVPTIGTRVGPVADWDGTAALAVPIGNSLALADAIERISADEPLRLRLAEAAQARALAADADDHARRTRSLYAMLIEEKRVRRSR